MTRAIIMVIDSMGIGAMPDCKEFNDVPECNTLKHVCEFNKGLNIPNLEKMGLGNLQDFDGIKKVENPIATFATLVEKSKGKDTTTGHWEIAGIVLDRAFSTFPNGFPQELIDKFIKETNCGGILANCPASGTAIIEKLNDEHHATKFPIIYTSADSVFQIAVDTDLIPLETLYKWCEIARRILTEDDYYVSRVIARPYKIIDGKPTRISKDRRDYSIEPVAPTLLNEVKDDGGKVIGIGKIEDIFSKSGITHAIHTGSNKEGLELTLKAIKEELPLEEIAYEKVDLQTMLDELEANALKAEKTYQNKFVEVVGKISNFDSDGTYISIEPENADPFNFTSVMCYIKNDAQLNFLLEKEVGDTVTVKGKITSIGEVLGYSIKMDEVQ